LISKLGRHLDGSSDASHVSTCGVPNAGNIFQVLEDIGEMPASAVGLVPAKGELAARDRPESMSSSTRLSTGKVFWDCLGFFV
jgi:hypothetical protein